MQKNPRGALISHMQQMGSGWQESGPCFRLRRVPTHFTLQREMYDSAKMLSVSALNFGNNLLREKERIWKQFVIVRPSFLFPLTKVILTIDLSSAWMAFPSFLGCHCCSQTELFNSARQCCFRPRLLGKALKLLYYCMLTLLPKHLNTGAFCLSCTVGNTL